MPSDGVDLLLYVQGNFLPFLQQFLEGELGYGVLDDAAGYFDH